MLPSGIQNTEVQALQKSWVQAEFVEFEEPVGDVRANNQGQLNKCHEGSREPCWAGNHFWSW